MIERPLPTHHHDPCRGCSFPVQEPNNNYPTYGSFPPDSIGVFGHDPVNDIVFNPASATDFMTAVVPPIAWVSPYTYKLLLPAGETGPAPASAMSLYRGECEMLFLGLEIARDRSVVRRPSFHHPALIQGVIRAPLDFTWELLDAKRRVLDCGQLHGDPCSCGCHGSSCGCWPKRTRDIIPYPKNAAFLAVYDGDKRIHEEEIPRPPQVRIDSQQAEKDGIAVGWTASPDAVAFLVHCRDENAHCWRALVPRTTETKVVVPWAAIRRARKLPIRVLATSGIATGYAEAVLETDGGDKPDVTLTLLGPGPLTERPRPMPAVVRAIATDASGVEVPGGQITWFDSTGRTLSRGAEVDLRQLGTGQHLIRAVVRSHGGRLTGKSWAIERKGQQFFLRAVVSDPPLPPPSPPHQHPHPAPQPSRE
jgi:hypothetical protein